MMTSKKYLKITINILTMLAGLAFCIWALPALIRFFMPFIIAGVIAMIANPIVRFLEKRIKIKRKAGSAFVIMLVIALVSIGAYAIISWLIEQFIGFVKIAPSIWAGVSNSIESFQHNIAHSVRLPFEMRNMADYNAFMASFGQKLEDGITSWVETTIAEMASLSVIADSASSIPLIIVSTITSILAAYMFVADNVYLKRMFHKFAPQGVISRIDVVTDSIKSALGGYFAAQLKIMAVVYVILLVGLWILKVDFFGLVALLIAILDFLPFFGTGTAMIPWALIVLIQGNYRLSIGLLIVWGVSQLVRQIIQPKLLSVSIGLDPIPTLFLLYVGFRVGGALGLILAAPIGLIVLNLYKAGLFSNFLMSIKLLLNDFSRLRRFTKEEEKEWDK